MPPAIDNSLTSSDRTASRNTTITALRFPATTGPPGLQSARRLLHAAWPHKNSGRHPNPPPTRETARR